MLAIGFIYFDSVELFLPKHHSDAKSRADEKLKNWIYLFSKN